MEARKITLRYNKEKYWMKVIKIEKCAQCPWSTPLYKTQVASYLICDESRAKKKWSPNGRSIDKDRPIPDWCELEEWKGGK